MILLKKHVLVRIKTQASLTFVILFDEDIAGQGARNADDGV
jgi:hypothetical protein